MTDIRKISVGKDYPDRAMHYQVGTTVRLQGEPYKVDSIIPNQNLRGIGKDAYDIFIKNDNGKVLWKTIVDVPVVVENNIDFD